MASIDDRLRDELRRLPAPDVTVHDDLGRVTARAQTRRRAARGRAAGALVAFLVLVAGAAVAVERARVAVVAEPGWDQLGRQPITTNAFGWVGGKLIAFGGQRGDRLLNEGHAYDPSRGRWDRIPDAPFEHALFRPGLLVAGDALLVWGAECGRILEFESATLRCTAGQEFAMALYRPATRHWQELTLPADLGGPCGAVGSTGELAVFLECGDGMLLLDPHESRWDKVALPFRPRRVCVAGNAVVAADWTDQLDAATKTDHGVISPGGTARPADMGLRAATYDLAARAWSSVVSGPRAGAPFFTFSFCAGMSLVVVGGEQGTPPTATSGHRFDTEAHRWEVTKPPATASGESAIWTGTEALVRGEHRGTAFGYDPSTNQWRDLPPLPRVVEFGNGRWAGDRVAFLYRGRLLTWVPGSP